MTASRPLERGARAAEWIAAPRVDALALRAAGTAAATAAVGCGLVLAVRRIAGAIDPATPALLLGTVAAGLPLVLAADAARRGGGPLAGPVAARCGLVLAVAALAMPRWGTDAGGWTAFAAVLAAVTAAVVRMPLLGTRPCRADRESVRRRGPSRPAARSRREPQPGTLRQRFERRELPAGTERVRGRVVVSVPAGARTGYGHLGFCPAFASTPVVEVATAYDGVEATVTAAEVLPWGVRVECRLAEPADEPLEIPVDLVASAAPASA